MTHWKQGISNSQASFTDKRQKARAGPGKRSQRGSLALLEIEWSGNGSGLACDFKGFFSTRLTLPHSVCASYQSRRFPETLWLKSQTAKPWVRSGHISVWSTYGSCKLFSKLQKVPIAIELCDFYHSYTLRYLPPMLSFSHPAPRIEKAISKDFLAISALDREIWRHLPHGDLIADGEHVWRIWCEHALIYIARDEDDKLAGVILAFPGVQDLFCVHKVMVAPQSRGQGLGSKLFSALLSEIDRLNARCFLTVDPENHPAVALYRNWGFTEEQFVPGYYRANEHRLVLTRHPEAAADTAL